MDGSLFFMIPSCFNINIFIFIKHTYPPAAANASKMKPQLLSEASKSKQQIASLVQPAPESDLSKYNAEDLIMIDEDDDIIDYQDEEEPESLAKAPSEEINVDADEENEDDEDEPDAGEKLDDDDDDYCVTGGQYDWVL